MQLPITTVTTLFIILDVSDSIISQDHRALDVMFRQRTRSDWEKVWHHESHSRCREKLVKHLYWACEKDIYRLSRRSSSPTEQNDMPHQKRTYSLPWLDDETAKAMLRTRRGRRRIPDGSITSECCTRVGCTWEEYAEYCPSNKRIR